MFFPARAGVIRQCAGSNTCARGFPRTRGGDPPDPRSVEAIRVFSSHARGITLLQFAKAEHRMPIKKNTTVWGNPKRTVRRQLSLAVVNSSIPEKTKTVNGMDRERDEVFPAYAEAPAISPCTSAAF